MKLALKPTAELLSDLKHQRRADPATVKELETRWVETTRRDYADELEDGSLAKFQLAMPNFAILAGTECL